MFTVIGVLKTIIMLGVVQGAIAGCLLYWSKHNRKANRFLARLIWLIALACLDLLLLQESVLYTTTLGGFIDAFIPMMVIMPIGPLLYFYIRASVEPDFQWQKQYRPHFYSTLLDILPQLAAICYITGVLTGLVKKAIPLGYYIDVYNMYVDIPRWLSLTIYLYLSYRYLANAPAASNSLSLRWLRQLVRVFMAFQVLWLLFLVPYVIPRYSDKLLKWVDWYPVYIPLCVLVYWLGIKALLVHYTLPVAERKPTIANTLPADTVAQTIHLLKNAMEQHTLYLDPALNLSSLAAHIAMPSKTISAVLNQHLHTSFNEYLNEYRITEFKKRLLEADLQNLTIAGIAFDCGFNSQATFQRAFKQLTGMSPSEYRRSAIEKQP